MESSGLTFVPTTVPSVATVGGYKTNKFNSNSGNETNIQSKYNSSSYNKSSKGGGSLGKDLTSLLLSDQQVVMTLDPDIELLVQYTDFAAQRLDEEEQHKKWLVAGTKPFVSGSKASSSSGRPQVKVLKNHVAISEDVKTAIYTEQRKLAIQWKVMFVCLLFVCLLFVFLLYIPWLLCGCFVNRLQRRRWFRVPTSTTTAVL
jgi:hypothetical protein